ncbi:glycine betaine/proline transport system permease protein/glycine betaine/proline transport system substrate-binding protein [Lentibacillus persicus]|uniref:Glycine betaine/proline transport system permease protein/glycine betaine/proline transport system substrate-binding protein n=1 Tax=Lentibacillus persicus TaxID=640948 RepID=A0A1I1S1F9_9BACI|nr:proline/glycine betaine ABC transporter permease [Lentibacillus persicus]SFD36790.1 glycine betaine/proline transport system permease protein/glycine betaine/proline transport system substrate-binding protein [Lentibacillus persicus]
MNNEGTLFPKLPLAEWVESFVDFLTANLSVVFDSISAVVAFITENFVVLLEMVPPLLLIVLVALLAWWVVNWKLGLFALIGLGLINNLGYWPETLETVALVIVSVVISMVIGIPIGIWMSQKASVQAIVTPILDFMQTMPAFVYLIPAVVFFSLGMVPGVVATIIFSMPPTVRLTNLGIRQVDQELIEASNAFGSSTGQRLGKVQIPLAMPTIMAGINQTIMLSLSMVVIASMVGAPGLGTVVYRAVTQVAIGPGFEGGLSLVILAMLLDRITQGANAK